jgi:glutamine synthetase
MDERIQELIAFAKAENVVAIDLKYTDLFGGWHHITVPQNQFVEDVFERGVAFDGSSIPGFARLERGDMVVVPDPSTANIDPFCDHKTLSMICDVRDARTLEPFPGDPRRIARRAEEYLIETGIADVSYWGPEFEFYIFDSIDYGSDINYSFYQIDSMEADWNSRSNVPGNLGGKIPRRGGYHAIPPMDRMHNLRSEMVRVIESFGIKVRYHHHEVGGPGQSEIEVQLGTLLKIGDASQTIKYIVKMVAQKNQKTATFIPKPLFDEAGSGMHFHQRLEKDGEPIFYDENGYAGLSETALHYIGGLLHHGPALLAITNPSTISYKRLIPGFEAPVNLIFGLANRSATIRIPRYAFAPHEKRIEFRPPDGTCNIYLAMAAQLLAGIDGIKRKIDPTKEGFGPVDVNVFTLPPEERAAIKALPGSLKEALEALQHDNEFLSQGKIFPSNFVSTLITYKMEKEYNAVRNRPHPYEMRLYYDV